MKNCPIVKLSNEITAFVPRDNVIFYGISLKFMISQCSVRFPVGYYSIPRSRVTRGHHALKQYGVRELLFVISLFSNRRFDLNKDFQDVCYLYDPKDTCSNILKRKRQKLRYT
jgi:hypothetical protein